MHITRYVAGHDSFPAVGVLLTGRILPVDVPSLASLWSLHVDELRNRITVHNGKLSIPATEVRILAPIDGRTEVWAAGVTYELSLEARVEESARDSDVYRRVYSAERPELFFKSAAWRVAGDGDRIAVRDDSTLDVPEPELAVVCNRYGEVVGFTVCNDVSSRSIEGANPLYLPQAKTYLRSCALGSAIRPAWEIEDPYQLRIELVVEQAGAVVWSGEASTSRLHRRIDELVSFLYRADVHPDGAVLSTGTCLVPDAPFSLTAGDIVRIAIQEIGSLVNPVVRGMTELLPDFAHDEGSVTSG